MLNEVIIADFLTQSIVFFAAFYILYPIKNYLKTSFNKAMVSASLTSLIYMFIASFLHRKFDISLLLLLFIFSPFFFIRVFRITKLSFWKLLFIFSFSTTLVAFPAIYAQFLDYLIYGNHKVGNQLGLITVVIAILWWIFFSVIYALYLQIPYKWIIEYYRNERVFKVLWLFPAITALIIVYIIPTASQLRDPKTFQLKFDMTNFILLAFVFCLFILYHVFKEAISNNILKSEKLLLSMQVANYHKTIEYMDETRRMRHDFRHHFATISGLLETQNGQQAQEYIQKYLKTTSSSIQTFTQNAALNSLLNHYYAMALENKIETNYQINYPKESPINEVDLCSIIGNLLENATEATKTVPIDQKPSISVDIHFKKEVFIIISIKNNHNKPLEKQAHHFKSSKKNHLALGLKSVKATIHHYHGNLIIDHDDTQFEANILIDTSVLNRP